MFVSLADHLHNRCYEGECPISVGILLALDVASEVIAWDDHVRGDEDVDWIVDHCKHRQ
jgi:hypothetical protein